MESVTRRCVRAARCARVDAAATPMRDRRRPVARGWHSCIPKKEARRDIDRAGARDSPLVRRRRTEREEREGREAQGPAAPCSRRRQKWTWKTCMRSPAKRGYTEVHGPQACRVHHSSRGDGSTPLNRRLTCETTHGVVDWPWSRERYIMPNRGGAKERTGESP